MRYGLFALVAAIGAGVAYYAMNRQPTTEKAFRETPEPRHRVQGKGEREDIAALIDEVIHAPDVPDTPVKQAFEHALEAR